MFFFNILKCEIMKVTTENKEFIEINFSTGNDMYRFFIIMIKILIEDSI